MAVRTVSSSVRPQRWKEWSYRLLGPSSLHLKHEFYLWVCLSLLTVSSLQGVYRQSFGTESGDYIFCLVASLWLSRHLLVRWLITSDSSTTSAPTLLGLLTQWLSTVTLAGQYCDRPDLAAVNKHLSIQQSQDHATWKTQLCPTLLYTMQFWKLRCWYPLIGLMERLLPPSTGKLATTLEDAVGDDLSASSSRRDRQSNASTSWKTMLHPYTWIQVWLTYSPPLQFLVKLVVTCWMGWTLFVEPWFKSPSALTADYYETGQPVERNGFFRLLNPPTWSRMALWFAFPATLWSVVFFGRVLLPIPSLVAGLNVLPSVRVQTRASTTFSGKSKKHHKSDHKQDMPWAEQTHSIIEESRFRLFCKVSSLRILDAVIVGIVFPRTVLTCRATGHCSTRPMLWELSRILHPAGLTGPRATALEQPMFASMGVDRVAAPFTVLSIILVSTLLLLAQLSMLDKSHLAMLGYVAGEWTKVDDTSSIPKFGSSAPSQWEPRRRYKKGDMILHHSPGVGSSSQGPTIYKAASHSPEGPPFDLFLRATHDFFRNELGHPSTSYHVAMASNIMLLWVSVIFVVVVFCRALDYPTDALMTTLVANVIACYAIVRVGRMNHSELVELRQEMTPVTRK